MANGKRLQRENDKLPKLRAWEHSMNDLLDREKAQIFGGKLTFNIIQLFKILEV